MLYRYLWKFMEPFRRLRSKWVYARSIKGQVRGDLSRLKGQAGRLKQVGGQVKGRAGAMSGAGRGAPGAGVGAIAGVQQGGAMTGAPNPGGSRSAVAAGRSFKRGGFLWLKRVCTGCRAKMEKGWDSCPYCLGDQPAPATSQKTQAFMLNEQGTGNSNTALLGWLVPLRGPQRGELFTLATESVVGTDAGCAVVLQDNFMSAEHCKISAEGGAWVLKDLGSTNGTFVNDKRVDRHDLVDNDFVKVGQVLLKFKCI